MQIIELIQNKISTSGKEINDSIIKKFVAIEINRRVEVLANAIEKLMEFEREEKELNKPDIITYINNQKVEAISGLRKENYEKIILKSKNLKLKIETCLSDNTEKSYKELSVLIGNNYMNKND